MKKTFQYTITALVFIFVLFACNKEITEDLLVFFKVEFNETTFDAFVNTEEETTFTIVGIDDIAAGDYQIKYDVTEGSGSYFLNDNEITENEFVDLPAGPEFTIEYVGTLVGVNKVTVTLRDAQEREEEFVLTYNVNDTDFTFDVVPSSETTYVTGEIDLDLSIDEISSATYEIAYTFISPSDITTEGAGTISVDDADLEPDTSRAISVGDSRWQFTGVTLGTVDVEFTVTSSLGVSKSKLLNIVVGETPDFTFATVAPVTEGFTNAPLEINFTLEETAGNSSYTMLFTSNKPATIEYNGVTYTEDSEIPVTVGASIGVYSGSVSGTNELRFEVTNANTVPVTQVGNVTLELTDPDLEAPVIDLNGPEMVTLTVFDLYTETATATDNVDGNLTDQIVFGGDFVDTNSLGTFTRTYNVTDSSNNTATEVTRTINVVDDVVPVITILSPSINIGVGETFTETVAASDNFDGNITDQIVFGGTFANTNTLGSFTRTYNVTDSSGNAAVEVTRTINVVDNVKPVLLLNGPDSITLLVNDTYTETATASDNVDGNLTNSIVFGGTFVDTSTAGTYTRTYNVTDASGNAADEVTRTIIVESISTGPTWDLTTGLLTANPGDTVEITIGSGGSTGYTIQVEVTVDSPNGIIISSLSAGTNNSSDSDIFTMPASGQVYFRGEHNSVGSGSTLSIIVEGDTIAMENMGPGSPIPRNN